MKIAVTSQDRKSVTSHAGSCRKFRIFEVEGGRVIRDDLLELPRAQSFRESSASEPHPLDDVSVLITGGLGDGLKSRLEQKGIKWIVSEEADPEKALKNADYSALRARSQFSQRQTKKADQ